MNVSSSPSIRFESLLVVRLSAMGDIIHTMPAVTALRRTFPDATIGWLIEERWTELLCTPRYARSGPRSPERPLVDRIHTVNTAAWRRGILSFENWRQIAATLSALRSNRYQAVIDFQGAIRSAALARWSGAPIVFGVSQPREPGAGFFYNRKVLPRTSSAHVVQQALDLSDAVSSASFAPAAIPRVIPSAAVKSPEKVRFPVDPDADRKIDNFIAGRNDFVILNPGAGWGAKMWPGNRYGEVAKELGKDGLSSLINYGPGEEKLAQAVEKASAGAAQKISCSISELIALSRRARLLIGGDTGPLHLAAALNIPVVAIFGPTNPARNGPFATRSIVLRSANSLTDHSRHRDPEHGLLEITVAEVVSASRKLLQGQIAD